MLLAAFDPAGAPQQLVNGIMTGAIYALIALGYTMVYGVLRLINFAHGEVFMLGSFVALFISWMTGFTGISTTLTSNPMYMVLMLVGSMLVCGLIGVLIERFAYRPMRNQPRIASLITAIGISLLLQHGCALVFPVSPKRTISQSVNPYDGAVRIPLRSPSAELRDKAADAEKELKRTDGLVRERMKQLGAASVFAVPADDPARVAKTKAEHDARKLREEVNASSVDINISRGRIIMFVTTFVLMALLRHLVMYTALGRQMRAVSHDFDSASLMGINVNWVVASTFFIGSALAGAGGMMVATFMGLALDTFIGIEYGVKAFIAAVLGGIGNIPGAVLGGLLMGLAEASVTAAGFSSYKDVIAFLILIVVLLFRPGGLLGSAKVEKV